MTRITTELNLAGTTPDVGQPPIVDQLPLRIKWIGIWIIGSGILLVPSIISVTVWFQ